MCYELSDWAWKARAIELARKEREAAKAAKKESKPVAPAGPVRPDPRVEEPETVPA